MVESKFIYVGGNDLNGRSVIYFISSIFKEEYFNDIPLLISHLSSVLSNTSHQPFSLLVDLSSSNFPSYLVKQGISKVRSIWKKFDRS